ncbi:hypothetical protein GGU11DRAFT_752052 [Lentinula aff. detonsa]|nr:hypothetical protein GGU11DRAFT_752052 [Lentinula aff. detonsa]
MRVPNTKAYVDGTVVPFAGLTESVLNYKNAFACATFLDTGNQHEFVHSSPISHAPGSNFALCRASV